MPPSDIITSTISATDPTGVLSVAKAAIELVSSTLRAIPAVKHTTHSIKSHSTAASEQRSLHRAQTAFPAAEGGVKVERERQAYETVHVVLQDFGSRVCAAGVVDEHALAKALNSAAQRTDFNPSSGVNNRLFASLEPKLGDFIFINETFTAIYFISALIAELSRSLPNYKDSYAPLGPRIVQQLFRSAIGEDAFRANLAANLDAYKTFATTADLSQRTDTGYSAFPGLPSLSPCRYTSRSVNEVRYHKSVYDRLFKHFDRSGFPQPTRTHQKDVGMIRGWRFLTGDSPSRKVEVERADRNIGENFGEVLHWLIYSAQKISSGQAVIAYYDQHVELIKWMGTRLGYCVLLAATDLDWSGVHTQLDPRARAIANTWVVLMPSARAQADGRASSVKWEQTQNRIGSSSLTPEVRSYPRDSRRSKQFPQAQIVSSKTSFPPPTATSSNGSALLSIRQRSHTKTIDQRLDDVEVDLNNVLLPQCNQFLHAPPPQAEPRNIECKRLTQHIEKAIIGWLDGFPIPHNHPAQRRRRAMVVRARQILDSLDCAPKPVSTEGPGCIVELTGFVPSAIQPVNCDQFLSLSTSPDPSSLLPTPTTLPPPYSPTSLPSATSSISTSAFPFPEKLPAKKVARRKAPPPPKNFIHAKALYDFQPEAGDDDSLPFKEGDDIEVVEMTAELKEDGWCKARVQGIEKTGLVPLEYIKMEARIPSARHVSPVSPQPATASTIAANPAVELYASPCAYTAIPSNAIKTSSDERNPAGFRPPHQAPQSTPTDIFPADFEKELEVVGLGITTVEPADKGTTTVPGQAQSQDGSDQHLIEPPFQSAERCRSMFDADSLGSYNKSAMDVQDNRKKCLSQTPPPAQPINDDSHLPIIDLSAFSFPPFEPQPLDFTTDTISPVGDQDICNAVPCLEIGDPPPVGSTNTAAKNQTVESLSTGTVISPFVSTSLLVSQIMGPGTTPTLNTENNAINATALSRSPSLAVDEQIVSAVTCSTTAHNRDEMEAPMKGPIDYDDLGYES